MRCGDIVTLPSGRRVAIVCAAVVERPWAAVASQWLWHVVREHGIAGRPSVSFYCEGGRVPLQLDEADAKALAEALNLATE